MSGNNVVKPPHLSAISDRPISTEGEDLLGRKRFARGISDLILSAPPTETLRIGIYGGWGEGKTSVLRLIEAALRDKGHPVVWITPWATATRQALVANLIEKLADELGISLRVTLRQWIKPFKAAAQKSADAASLDPRLKAAESLLGDGIRSLLDRANDDQVAAVFKQIRERIGERKMVVMVDDLDRVRPELVPDLLLLLREALDQPNYFYILAFDPAVVTRGLEKVHAAWGESNDFLEKIIELPRRLSTPGSAEIRAFIHEQIDKSDRHIHKETLEAIAPVLSRNPRKLKLLLRYLASLAALTQRLDSNEIDWEVFYLCQMLRLEFSDEALRLADDPKAVEDLEMGAMHSLLAKNQPPVTSRAYDPYVPKAEPAAKRFRDIAEAIRMRGRWKGRYGVRACLLLPDEPPLITYLEFTAFIQSFAALPAGEQKAAVEKQVADSLAPRAVAVAALFDFAVTYRQLAMEHAVDAETDNETRERLRVVADITTILELLASMGALAPDADGAARFHRLLKHISSWAQFLVPAYHVDMRAREQELVRRFMGLLEGNALLATYEQWDEWEIALTLPATHSFAVFLGDLRTELAARVSSMLLSRFTAREGMNMFWGDTWVRVKRLLFAADSPIFDDDAYRQAFLGLAQRSADGDAVLAENFLTYLRMLDYAAFGEALTFDRKAARELIAQHDVVASVWNAAIAIPLQPRQVGSLSEKRQHLIAAGVPEQLLIKPEWFVATERLFEAQKRVKEV